MKIILMDFNSKIDKENIFYLTVGTYSPYDISTDNGIQLVNFAIAKKNDHL